MYLTLGLYKGLLTKRGKHGVLTKGSHPPQKNSKIMNVYDKMDSQVRLKDQQKHFHYCIKLSQHVIMIFYYVLCMCAEAQSRIYNKR